MISTLNTLWIFFVFSYFTDLVLHYYKHRYFRPHPLFSFKKGGLFFRYPYVIGAYVVLYGLGWLLKMPMHLTDNTYGFIVYTLLSFMQFTMMLTIILTLVMVLVIFIYTKVKKSNQMVPLTLTWISRLFLNIVVSSALVSLVLNIYMLVQHFNP